MDLILWVVFGFAALAATPVVIRRSQLRNDAERRALERKAWQERKRERASQKAWATLHWYYPFARDAIRLHLSSGKAPRDALRAALDEGEGIRLGTGTHGFPAVLPLSQRRKHLIILGKSGFGKTTIGLRLIQDDLRQGRGICVLGAEAEFFRDWLLPLVPRQRAEDVVYLRPADPRCTLSWNALSLEDGEDQALAAGELFGIFKRAVGEASIGARADAILSSAFAVLVGRPGATLWSVIHLLSDESYRAAVVEATDDPYLREFWATTFPTYPEGSAALPLINRLTRFLRLPQLRATLCHPVSSFSIREALAKSRILFFDLSGLDPDAITIVGRLLLARFQGELMMRERVCEKDREPIHVFLDEFHQFAASAEGTWRELLARGRRYGLGLHLFTQHPNQLPRSLQHEIFGNVSSLIALNLSAGDAAGVRRELLVPAPDGTTKPIPTEKFVSLPVGEGYARLGSGACALRVKFLPPIDKPDAAWGDEVREISWKKYAAPPVPAEQETRSQRQRVEEKPPRPRPSSASVAPARGRGSRPHRLIQDLARQWGEERGFRAVIEQPILDGAGRVDVALARAEVRVAIEVAVTSTPQQIAESVGKYLAAGFSHVAVVSEERTNLAKAEGTVLGGLSRPHRDKLHFLAAADLPAFLDGLPGRPDGSQMAGYRVVVTHASVPEPAFEARRRTLAALVGKALIRRRPSS